VEGRLEGRSVRDEFLRKLKEEWRLMWMERFDDKVRAEGVAVRDYQLLLMGRGFIIFASRDAKAPSLSEIIEYWAGRGMVYAPDPKVGGWGKFIRTFLLKPSEKRKALAEYAHQNGDFEKKGLQLKKGGRGWLHKV